MKIVHHIEDDLLLAYAAGSLAEGWNLVVACHLVLCGECRKRLAAAEAMGGSLIEDAQTADVHEDVGAAWSAVRARIADSSAIAVAPAPAPAKAPAGSAVFPGPLREYIGGDIDAVRWQNLGAGNGQYRIKLKDGRTQARLLRIPAGKPVPEHSHGGRELTLVLSGAFRDGEKRFERGDVEEADDSVLHQPIATEEADCICLAVTDAPLRFRSRLVRFMQPFIGI